MGQLYRTTKTTVSLINYHFVFCPRYRRKVLVNQVEQQFKQLVQEMCTEHDWILISMDVMPDHVHIFLNALPTDSPTEIVARLKGVSSRRLREQFKHLMHLPSLWTRSYFVSTEGDISSETIKRYVEEQKKRG
ncbi:IS200/IS605 family transposase [Paenibacillus periandrae]|uniref:IS200/IS605 family transposase n=1 Tax=Paenibacillus periandrae TaxID=1761741 RepID=UPI001F08B597|nr:IS200/IS605 family transposase [Paenibacillus periandrae]